MSRSAVLLSVALLLLAGLPAAAGLTVTPDLSVPAGHAFTLEVLSDLPAGSSVIWRQHSGPVRLLLRPAPQQSLSLLARWTGRYVFECSVRAPGGPVEARAVTVTVTAAITRPVAVVFGPLHRVAGAGEWVYLAGDASHDPTGRALEYRWAQVSGPTAQVKKGSGRKPLLEFMPEEPGKYVFSLQVIAGHDVSEPQVAIVEVPVHPAGGADHAPVLGIDAPAGALVGRRVRLDASATRDPDGDAVSIGWETVSLPAGANIAAASGPVLEFVPAVAGQYRFRVRADALTLSAEKEVVVTAAPATEPASAPVGAPGRRLSLDWRTVPLADALSELSGRFGVNVLVSPRLLAPERFESTYVDLSIREAPLEIVLTWLARSLGGYYHVQSADHYWLEAGYGFLRDEAQEAFTVPLGPAYEGIEDVAGWFECAMKPIVMASGRTNLLARRGNALSGVLPASAVKRLSAVAAAASGAPPVRHGVGGSRPACAALEASVRLEYDGIFIRDLLWDIGRQAGVNIGFNCRLLPAAGRKALSVHLGSMTLREALDWAGKQAGIPVVSVDAADCLWLDAGEALPPGGCLWDTARCAGFDLTDVLRAGRITPTLVTHLLQRRVWPATWSDPAAALLYLPRLKRLLVVNHPWVLAEVEKFLGAVEHLDYRYWGTAE